VCCIGRGDRCDNLRNCDGSGHCRSRREGSGRFGQRESWEQEQRVDSWEMHSD
jgi:hypothetical protein